MKKKLMISALTMVAMSLAACNNMATDKTTTESKQATAQTVPKKVVQEKDYYYTANAGSISKIDAVSNKVVKTIQEEGSVHNVQVSPDGEVLGATLVPSMGHGGHDMAMNGFAVFYDTATGKLLKKVEVGEHPAHIVFSADGKYVLVTNNEGNDVSVLDGRTYEKTASIPVGKGPHGFRISPDNQTAYVANMGEYTVSVVDLQKLKEVKKITVGDTPVTTGITSDGSTVVVTLHAENAAAIMDVATGRVEKVSVGKGPAQVYIQSDDKYAFVANQGTEKEPSDSISKIDLQTKRVVATIQTGAGAHGIVTSADDKYIYVTNMLADTVSVVDNTTNAVIATVPVGEEPNGITFQAAK